MGCGFGPCLDIDILLFFKVTIIFFQVLSTMARRARSSRAWHFVLSAARRDTDARAVALAGNSNWDYDSDGQVGLSGKVGLTRVWGVGELPPGMWCLEGRCGLVKNI